MRRYPGRHKCIGLGWALWEIMPIEDVGKAKALISQRTGIVEEDFVLEIEWQQHDFKYETYDPPYCSDGGKEWDDWMIKAVIRSEHKSKAVENDVRKMVHDLIMAVASGV